MDLKIIVTLGFIAAVNAGFLQNVVPAATIIRLSPAAISQPVAAFDDQHDSHPQYNFAYDIQDGISGDSKSQSEARDGDVVRGQYSVIDADGLKRIVDYTADSVNGFNAIVRRTPVATVVASTPVASVSHGLGIVKASYSSPIISYAH